MPAANTEAPSLFELGLGAGAAWLPHYPGSDQTRLFAIPFPYAVYRGSILRSDRDEGTRARFLRRENYEISLSGGGALPVSSENNTAREGMPDLGWLAELGPKIRVSLADFPNKGSLRFAFAVRAVFASQTFSTFQHRGWVLEPQLIYERPRLIADRIGVSLRASSLFSTAGFASYLYDVPDEFARAGRPAYSAKAGYLYSSAGISFGFRTKDEDQRFFIAGSVDSLDGAANQNSPLVKTKINTTFAIAFISVLYHSKRKATD